MNNPKHIPDAWDDDWEEQVDNKTQDSPAPTPAPQQESGKKISSRAKKAQLRAQHAEFNRQLWAEAEAEAGSNQMSHYLESRSKVPLKSEYKPTVKVLSRNPQSSPGLSAATAGLQRVTISPRPTTGNNDNANEIEDEDNSDEETKQPKELTPEERLAIAQREREEKQRKYEEVRERLFGSSNAGSGASSPGSTTPPRQQQQPQHTSGENKWKGKARSNGANRDRGERRDSSSRSARGRQLYDPNYVPKPNSNHGKRRETRQQFGGGEDSRPRSQPQSQSPQPQMPIRSPRGPDGSGPGGFGFCRAR
ncbi:hypothetical protein CISG_01163 [Coccidioides immitis RMSCC 3703]|uniref:Uncharacterized protein n=1 Tax=Coccidioides immitis RMSCC 3703 TaxID=454286 RepID=A0A0J8QWJ9_COCIT|nr:hypothetical protein CISG_01163 [Coccidioides immitis RMSCC 3703]